MILLYVHAAPNAQPTRVPYFPQSSIISSAIYITPVILRLSHNSQTHKLSTLLLAAVPLLLSQSSSFNPPKVSKMPSEGTANCIDIILAIILPPLGVFLKFGCHVEFWICLLLTIFGYLPGIIYAIYVITK